MLFLQKPSHGTYSLLWGWCYLQEVRTDALVLGDFSSSASFCRLLLHGQILTLMLHLLHSLLCCSVCLCTLHSCDPSPSLCQGLEHSTITEDCAAGLACDRRCAKEFTYVALLNLQSYSKSRPYTLLCLCFIRETYKGFTPVFVGSYRLLRGG